MTSGAKECAVMYGSASANPSVVQTGATNRGIKNENRSMLRRPSCEMKRSMNEVNLKGF